MLAARGKDHDNNENQRPRHSTDLSQEDPPA
jgi:hypothetical protein